MDTSMDMDSLPAGLGGIRPLEIPATRYRQGQREMYDFTIPLSQLPQLIAKRPDPNEPIDGNRKVDLNRAKAFAKYLTQTVSWVSPAIIVRAPSGEVQFTPVKEFPDGTAWGVLSIPLHVLTEIILLDGQHRTLGVFIALDELNRRIAEERETQLAADRTGDKATAAARGKEVDKLRARREKIANEHIPIELAVVSKEVAKQMFVDINNNAKGVNADFTSFLDKRDIINEIAVDLAESHPLLSGRVESGQSARMSPSNPNFIGVKGLADIIRALHVGVNGRVGARVEDELRSNREAATQAASHYLDILVAAFPAVDAVMTGELTPVEVRQISMIGSVTMLRVLAGTTHLLRQPERAGGKFSDEEIADFMKTLDAHMRAIPIAETDKFWLPTGAFIPGTRAPQARQGSLSGLANALVRYAEEWRVNANTNA